MARPVEAWRMDVWHIIKSDDGNQWTIPTHRKTDKGTRTSFLTCQTFGRIDIAFGFASLIFFFFFFLLLVFFVVVFSLFYSLYLG
jgi:hypothetical protein